MLLSFFDKSGRLIATTHLAVGAVAGLWSSRLVAGLVSSESAPAQITVQAGIAFLVGTISHVVLDSIPHNDGIYKTAHGTASILVPELVIIFSVIFGIAVLKNLSPVIIFAGLVGAAWLDVFSMFGLMSSTHSGFHSLRNPGLVGSLVTQLVIAVIALIFLI